MNFVSIYFFVFLLAVVLVFYALPKCARRWFLLISSYIFYGAFDILYCALPLFSTAIDYYAARRISATTSIRAKRWWLALSVIANISLLCFFKYIDFLIVNTNSIFELLGYQNLETFGLLLPIGISFYTFQSMSYTIDVYRNKQKVQNDFSLFSLYVVFFPQLIAGPIERAKNLLPQLLRLDIPSRSDIEYGIQRILWGLVKKLVFADRLGILVGTVYANPANFSAAELSVATLCFTFQLYLDFSAYCDIAIGMGRLFGVKLSENFNYPFLATTPSDFWNRWHITLTNWFRDYVFRALGGVRRSKPFITLFNILLVMSLVGLWHGPEWTYVVFGLLSGLAIVVHLLIKRLFKFQKKTSHRSIGRLSATASNLAMMAVISGILIFFRSDNLNTASDVIYGIATKAWTLSVEFYPGVILLCFVWILHLVRGYTNCRTKIQMAPFTKGCFWSFLILCLLFGSLESEELFIYFQF